MQSALSQVQSPRFGSALRTSTFALAASVAIFSTASTSFGGLKEIAAIEAELGNTIASETSPQDLVNAFKAAVLKIPTSRLKAGILAGEILRLSTVDIGGLLGAEIEINPATAATAKTTVALDAIKTAGTGKAPNVSNIPKFAAEIVPVQADAIALAKAAKSSKAGVGAVLGGYSSLLASDAARIAFANSTVFTDRAFTAAALEISKSLSEAFTADNVGTGVNFATQTGTVAANVKFADKIIVGTIAGNPLEAGAITDVAQTIILTPASGTKPAVNLLGSKGIALAKSIGAVADIEQIQKVGESIAEVVKLSQATAVATALGKAIIAKPFSATQVFSPNSTDIGRVTNSNKIDELGELAAYMLNALTKTADYQKAGGANANKAVFALIKSLVTTAKVKLKVGQNAGPTLAAVLDRVTGSVARTLQSLVTAGTAVGATPAVVAAGLASKAALDTLKLEAKVAALAKLTGTATTATALVAIVNTGASQSGGGINGYEDGTVALGTGGLGLTDAETNSRNL